MKDMLDKIFPKRTSPKKMKLPNKANNILDLFPKQKSSIGTKVFPKKALTPKPLRMKPFILGDFVTKKQKAAIKKDPFSDWDGDRVINGLDCQPKNKKKHMAFRTGLKSNIPTIEGYFDDRNQEPAYSKRRVEMDVDKFLERQYKQSDGYKSGKMTFKEWSDDKTSDKEYIQQLANAIKSKDPTVPVPVEFFNRDGSWFDNEQEGAHRGFASKKAGLKTIPVIQTRKRLPPWDRVIHKNIPIDEAYEMRNKHAGAAGMEIHRSDTTMNNLRDLARKGELPPIDVQESTYNKGIIDDGKHRILASKDVGKENIWITIHPDEEDLYQRPGSQKRQTDWDTEEKANYISEKNYDNERFEDLVARQKIREIREVDKDGNCLGNCVNISKAIKQSLPNSRIISSSPKGTYSANSHKAVITKDGDVIDTQRWQHNEQLPSDIDNRVVKIPRKDYEEQYDILDEENDS